EGGASGDDRPKLPSQQPVDSAETPPALQELLVLGDRPELADGIHRLAFQPVLERFDHAWHRDQHGDALAPYGGNHLAGLETLREKHRTPNQRGDEDAHELAEHMAQGHHSQKTYRMEDAFVFAILGKLSLNGTDAGQNVAVRQHYAARIGGGSRGK